MTEHGVDLRKLIKDVESEIIISDEQIDENGKVVINPVLVFATGGERVGYITIMELQSWIIHHIYAPEIISRKAYVSFEILDCENRI
jgi:hypothetical protein